MIFTDRPDSEKVMSALNIMNDWLLRNCELVDKYKPQVFWFDWWIEQPAMEPYRKTFAAYYYNHGHAMERGVVINYKNNAYPDNVAVYDIERGSSKASRKYPLANRYLHRKEIMGLGIRMKRTKHPMRLWMH